MGRSRYHDIEIRGVTYPSFAAAGRAHGVHANTVRAAYHKGTLHRVGSGRVGPEPMRVQIAGRVFDDVNVAAAHFGVQPMTVYAAISDGDPDRIARAQTYNPWKARSFTIGKLTFPSMRAASRALGFSDEEYIAKALKRGSKRGRERILAAAMAYEQRLGSRAAVLVLIAGVVFDDVPEAAAHYGVSPAEIYAALDAGDPDRIARDAGIDTREVTSFTIGGMTFASPRVAARTLGFDNELFIASVIKRGSRRGRARILEAVSRYLQAGVSA